MRAPWLHWRTVTGVAETAQEYARFGWWDWSCGRKTDIATVTLKGLRFALLNLLTLCVCLAAQDPGQTKLAEVRRLLAAGDWKRADELATVLASQKDASSEAYEMLGRVKDAEQRYEEADAAYRRALQLAPTAAGPHVSLGVSYVQRSQAERALGAVSAGLGQGSAGTWSPLSNTGSIRAGGETFCGGRNVLPEGATESRRMIPSPCWVTPPQLWERAIKTPRESALRCWRAPKAPRYDFSLGLAVR